MDYGLYDAPPPLRPRGRPPGSAYTEAILLLRANPGKWAMLNASADPTLATRLSRRYGVKAVRRNSHTDEKGRRRVEVWASYPEGNETAPTG